MLLHAHVQHPVAGDVGKRLLEMFTASKRSQFWDSASFPPGYGSLQHHLSVQAWPVTCLGQNLNILALPQGTPC